MARVYKEYLNARQSLVVYLYIKTADTSKWCYIRTARDYKDGNHLMKVNIVSKKIPNLMLVMFNSEVNTLYNVRCITWGFVVVDQHYCFLRFALAIEPCCWILGPWRHVTWSDKLSFHVSSSFCWAHVWKIPNKAMDITCQQGFVQVAYISLMRGLCSAVVHKDHE